MSVRVYLLDVAWLLQESGLEKREFCCLYERLSEGRQQKIRRFRHAEGRALSLGAGLLLDYGLSRYGLRERDAAIVYGADEKPYLRDYPEIFFNLSHSGTLAMAAFADREIGCDVERIAIPDMRVVHRFFAEQEVRRMEKAAALGQEAEYFYRFWTLKESFLKVTGRGIRMPLNEFCIHLGAQIQVERSGEFLDYSFAEFARPGYQMAYCTEGAEPEEVKNPEVLSWEQLSHL